MCLGMLLSTEALIYCLNFLNSLTPYQLLKVEYRNKLLCLGSECHAILED